MAEYYELFGATIREVPEDRIACKCELCRYPIYEGECVTRIKRDITVHGKTVEIDEIFCADCIRQHTDFAEAQEPEEDF